jgi:putative transposase
MSAHRFSTGKQFQWQGDTYEVKRLLSGQNLSIENVQTGQVQMVRLVQLYQALVVDELQFVMKGRPAKPRAGAPFVDLSDCPEELRQVAERRLEVIRPLLNLSPTERHQAIRLRVDELKQQWQDDEHTLHTAISVASVYRWLKDYLESSDDIRVLIPDTSQRGGRHQSRLMPDVEEIIQTVIDDFYYVRETRAIDFLYYETVLRVKEANLSRRPEEQLTPPSRSTVFRRIAARDTAGKLIAKRGKRAAQSALRAYETTQYPTMPLERVEIDHTPVDLIVVDQDDLLPLGRLTLTYCLDTATRYPLGYYLGFEPPSYLSVMECLYHAMLPKQDVQEWYDTAHEWLAYGIPTQLIIDNGKEFIGRDLDDACFTLGVVLERMPVKTPHFKAAVERMFGTTNTGILHGLPGTTFANVARRGDYESMQQACISLSELDQMMHIFLLDKYAESFHRGLEGVPARRWAAALEAGFFPRVPASSADLRILLGRVAYRTIQPYGIELHALRYQSGQLTSLRTRMLSGNDKRVKIKYHPADLSRIYVYDPDEQTYLEIPALAQTYTMNLSLWKHNVIRNFVLSEQDTVDIAALGEAQRKIQAIVEKSMKRKKLKTRRKAARWQESGHTPSLAADSVEQADGEVKATDTAPVDLEVDLETLSAEGWQVSYDLPQSNEGDKPNGR